MIALTVIAAFAQYQRGDQITDPTQIAAINVSANSASVVQVTTPDPAASAPSPA